MRNVLDNKKIIKNNDGQAVLETALVMPIILLLIMGGITLGILIFSQIVVTISASNGARVGGSIWHDESLTEMEKKEQIKNAALGMVEKSLAGDQRRYLINEKDGMLEVTVEYDFFASLPFSDHIFDNNTITIDSTAYYYVGES